jgi:hypothetical protein
MDMGIASEKEADSERGGGETLRNNVSHAQFSEAAMCGRTCDDAGSRRPDEIADVNQKPEDDAKGRAQKKTP